VSEGVAASKRANCARGNPFYLGKIFLSKQENTVLEQRKGVRGGKVQAGSDQEGEVLNIIRRSRYQGNF